MDFVVHGIPFFSLKEAASIYLHCLLGVLSLLSSTIFSHHSTDWFAVGREMRNHGQCRLEISGGVRFND
jgi:hypothetical protein